MNIYTECTGVLFSGNNRSFMGTKGIYQERCHCSEKKNEHMEHVLENIETIYK